MESNIQSTNLKSTKSMRFATWQTMQMTELFPNLSRRIRFRTALVRVSNSEQEN